MTIKQRKMKFGADVNATLEWLILSTYREHDLCAVLDQLGSQYGATLMVDEMVSRTPKPLNPDRIVVGLKLTHAETTTTFELTVHAETGVTAVQRQPEDPDVVVEFQLADLARTLFGPPHARLGRMHRTELRYTPARLEETSEHDPAEAVAEFNSMTHQISQVLWQLNQAWSASRMTLDELMLFYGSDKCGVYHWFTPHYERHCGHLRDQPGRFLEIGIGGYNKAAGGGAGGSLRAWKQYFTRGIVVGLDIFDKSDLDEPRIVTVKGDQSDEDQLRKIAESYGPFDVIVDDGSHINSHIHTSLLALFPYLRPGGVYAIEDLWTSYCPGYGGDDSSVDSKFTSIGLLKTITDAIHHEERGHLTAHIPKYLEENVVGMHVYHNIAFIEKGINAEGGVPGWIPRSTRS